jgi:HEAT repeat protein
MPEDFSVQIDRLGRGDLPIDEQRSLAADLGGLKDPASEATLISLLGNSDPIVRYNAIIALGFDRCARSASTIITAMLKSDPDEDCRSASAGALGQMFQKTKDQKVLQAVGVAALQDPDEGVRRSAYKAALIVWGVSPEEHLSLLRDETLVVEPDKIKSLLIESNGRTR